MVCNHFGPEDPRNGWVLPGPWFVAMFDSGDCPLCGERICEGEKIRANGNGSYEHQQCVDIDPFEWIK